MPVHQGDTQSGEWSAEVEDNSELTKLILAQGSILDRVGEAVVMTDMQDQIILWNQRAEELVKILAEEAVGKSVFDVVPQLEEGMVSRIADSVILSGSWKGEVALQRKDGSCLVASVSSSLVQNDDGNPLGDD